MDENMHTNISILGASQKICMQNVNRWMNQRQLQSHAAMFIWKKKCIVGRQCRAWSVPGLESERLSRNSEGMPRKWRWTSRRWKKRGRMPKELIVSNYPRASSHTAKCRPSSDDINIDCSSPQCRVLGHRSQASDHWLRFEGHGSRASLLSPALIHFPLSPPEHCYNAVWHHLASFHTAVKPRPNFYLSDSPRSPLSSRAQPLSRIGCHSLPYFSRYDILAMTVWPLLNLKHVQAGSLS